MRDPVVLDRAQIWKLYKGTNTGFKRIVPDSQPNYSIDIVNDGKNDKPWLDNTANLPGQLWKLTIIKKR